MEFLQDVIASSNIQAHAGTTLLTLPEEQHNAHLV